MCWSFLAGGEVAEVIIINLFQDLMPTLLYLAFIFSSLSKSQTLFSMPETLGVQLIFSDMLDISNILFLYPFFFPKIFWQKIVYNL